MFCVHTCRYAKCCKKNYTHSPRVGSSALLDNYSISSTAGNLNIRRISVCMQPNRWVCQFKCHNLKACGPSKAIMSGIINCDQILKFADRYLALNTINLYICNVHQCTIIFPAHTSQTIPTQKHTDVALVHH